MRTIHGRRLDHFQKLKSSITIPNSCITQGGMVHPETFSMKFTDDVTMAWLSCLSKSRISSKATLASSKEHGDDDDEAVVEAMT